MCLFNVYKLSFIIVFIVLFNACNSASNSSFGHAALVANLHITKSSDINNIKETTVFKNDTTIVLYYQGTPFETLIKSIDDSVSYNGTILALHGWDLSYKDWCDSTSLCDKAKAMGYVVVFPNMGKSIYSNRYYLQTRKDWSIYPTRKWFNDTLIPHLQLKFNLLDSINNNFIMGLSTGGKGAALIALDNFGLFNSVAILSGDFDQTYDTTSSFYEGYYGNYSANRKRWVEEDNVVYNIKDYVIPTYLGHGWQDDVVDVEETQLFHKAILDYHPNSNIELHIDSFANHNYDYWNSEVDAVLNFFNSTVFK